MKSTTKFLCYRKQSGGGCDYTIGCGERLDELKAQSFEEATKEVENLVNCGDPDFDPDRSSRIMDEVLIIDVSAVTVFNHNAFYNRCRDRIRDEKRKAVEEQERKQLETLQKKYGVK